VVGLVAMMVGIVAVMMRVVMMVVMTMMVVIATGVVLVVAMRVVMVVGGAIRRAGVRHRLVHDLLDGARAASALPAAAEAAINLTGGEGVLRC
jgi:hypothetical protein